MTRTDRIIAEARQGHRPAVIAARIGCTNAAVYETLCRARKRGIDVPRFPVGPVPGALSSTVRVSRKTRGLLELQALRHGCDAHQIADRILAKVAASDRIAAILLENG